MYTRPANYYTHEIFVFNNIPEYWHLEQLLKYGSFEKQKIETKVIETKKISLDFLLETALNFKTKDQYLHWSSNWKAIYKSVSDELRSAKHLYRQLNQKPWYISNPARCEYWRLKAVANLLLIMRKKSKELSHQQYLQSKENKSLLSKIIGKINGTTGS